MMSLKRWMTSARGVVRDHSIALPTPETNVFTNEYNSYATGGGAA